MLITFVHLIRRLSGSLLGGLAAGALAGDVLVCVGAIVLGPAYVLSLLSR